MKNNIVLAIIGIIFLLSTLACGQSSNVSVITPTASEGLTVEQVVATSLAALTPDASGSTEAALNPTATTASLGSAITADKGLFNVTITLPASYFENMTDFNPDAYSKENGFKETVVNDDGSITITMSKTKHNELMTEMKESLDQTLMELIESVNTPYIKDVTSSEGYTTVTVDVDKVGYESAFDLTPFTIGILVMMYQQFDGSELHCEVLIRDVASHETLKSVVYPDAWND